MNIIVIRSKTTEIITGSCSYEYSAHEIVVHGALLNVRINSRLVSKKEAVELINRYGLVEKHSTSDGEIYDTPDESFKKLFNMCRFSRYRRNALIESVDDAV